MHSLLKLFQALALITTTMATPSKYDKPGTHAQNSLVQPGCSLDSSHPNTCHLEYQSKIHLVPNQPFRDKDGRPICAPVDDRADTQQSIHVNPDYHIYIYSPQCILLATDQEGARYYRRDRPDYVPPLVGTVEDPPNYQIGTQSRVRRLKEDVVITGWKWTVWFWCRAGWPNGKCLAPKFKYGNKKEGGVKGCQCGYKGLPEQWLWECQCPFDCELNE